MLTDQKEDHRMADDNRPAKRVPIKVLVIYSLLFYSSWALYHFFLAVQIEKIPNELAVAILKDVVCKNLVWTLPAFLLIHKYSDSLKIKLSEMLTWKKEYMKYLLIFPAFAVYILLGFLLRRQPIEVSLTVGEIAAFIVVGISEELVFRGWLLNATINYAKEPENDDDIPWGQYGVIALNAVMFLMIHFPIWIMQGSFVSAFTQLGFISVIILSVIFSIVFLKTKNIALIIALHMFWDLILFAIE